MGFFSIYLREMYWLVYFAMSKYSKHIVVDVKYIVTNEQILILKPNWRISCRKEQSEQLKYLPYFCYGNLILITLNSISNKKNLLFLMINTVIGGHDEFGCDISNQKKLVNATTRFIYFNWACSSLLYRVSRHYQ